MEWSWGLEALIQPNFLLGILVGVMVAPLLGRGGSDDNGSA